MQRAQVGLNAAVALSSTNKPSPTACGPLQPLINDNKHPHPPPPILDAGVKFVTGKAAGVTHAAGRSTLALEGGKQIAGSLVLDATGHSRRLVEFDQKFDPGYQGAYGVIAEVESHPFDIDTMLFM